MIPYEPGYNCVVAQIKMYFDWLENKVGQGAAMELDFRILGLFVNRRFVDANSSISS